MVKKKHLLWGIDALIMNEARYIFNNAANITHPRAICKFFQWKNVVKNKYYFFNKPPIIFNASWFWSINLSICSSFFLLTASVSEY